jgi:hypothetical protein
MAAYSHMAMRMVSFTCWVCDSVDLLNLDDQRFHAEIQVGGRTVDKAGGDSEQKDERESTFFDMFCQGLKLRLQRVAKDERDATTIDTFEHILGMLAAGWRGYHTEGKHGRAQDYVSLYHAIMKMMWDWGWRGHYLFPDAELPDEHMPAYFVQYWVEYHKNRH